MTTFVLDASAALASALPSQSTANSKTFFATHDTDDFIAPHIYAWEVGNALLALFRRGLLSAPALEGSLAQMAALSLVLWPALTSPQMDDLLARARLNGLSLFDMSYLALAQAQRATLVSRDRQLLDAAQRSGVECLDLIGGVVR